MKTKRQQLQNELLNYYTSGNEIKIETNHICNDDMYITTTEYKRLDRVDERSYQYLILNPSTKLRTLRSMVKNINN